MSEFESPSEKDRNFVAEETGGEEETGEPTSNFVETQEMLELKQQAIEAGKNNSEQFYELASQWRDLAETAVNQTADSRAMVEVIMAQADIWKEIGDMANYNDDLEQALTFAENEGYEDLAATIRQKLY